MNPYLGSQPLNPDVGSQPLNPYLGSQPLNPYLGYQPLNPYLGSRAATAYTARYLVRGCLTIPPPLRTNRHFRVGPRRAAALALAYTPPGSRLGHVPSREACRGPRELTG